MAVLPLPRISLPLFHKVSATWEIRHARFVLCPPKAWITSMFRKLNEKIWLGRGARRIGLRLSNFINAGAGFLVCLPIYVTLISRFMASDHNG